MWTIRVDGEIVAMELFSEVAWNDNVQHDLIYISVLDFLKDDMAVDITNSLPESIAQNW